MKRLTKTLAAAGLCAALVVSGTGIVAAQTTQAQPQAQPQTQGVTNAAAAAKKDETVYVLSAADGSVERIIVSDYLQNSASSEQLLDTSQLTQLETVKGDASLSGDGDVLVWDTQGEDVYYQGETEKQPPVTLHVSYQLDGEDISAQALAGKSGQVRIRFTYENNETTQILLDGQRQTVCVPFAALTGLVLDNAHFRNIEVTNGRCYNDGERSFVVGLALPGMQQTLALNEQVLVLPESVEITADVTDFSLGMTLTLVTSEPFTGLCDKLEDSDAGALGQLGEAMTQLTDGSGALYDGLETLLASTQTLLDGTQELSAGAQSLAAGAASANTGAQQLDAGAATLAEGLETLSQSSETLNTGAQQVFAQLLASATQQLSAAGVSVPALTQETYAAVLDGLLAQLPQNSAQAQSIQALKASLDGYAAFYTGLCSYTAGVDSAAGGAQTLSDGAASLRSGTQTLSAGAQTLAAGLQQLNGTLPQLVQGAAQLKDGAKQLDDGLNARNNELVQKLNALVGTDAQAVQERAQAMLAAADSYQSFSGLHEKTVGQVRFVYRTDEICLATDQ